MRKFRLPRKEKKQLKKSDPEHYRLLVKLSRQGIGATRCGENLRDLCVSINSPGGTIPADLGLRGSAEFFIPVMTDETREGLRRIFSNPAYLYDPIRQELVSLDQVTFTESKYPKK